MTQLDSARVGVKKDSSHLYKMTQLDSRLDTCDWRLDTCDWRLDASDSRLDYSLEYYDSRVESTFDWSAETNN